MTHETAAYATRYAAARYAADMMPAFDPVRDSAATAIKLATHARAVAQLLELAEALAAGDRLTANGVYIGLPDIACGYLPTDLERWIAEPSAA